MTEFYIETYINNLSLLYCNNNQLTSLHELNKNLQKIYCSNNKLTSASIEKINFINY